METTTSLDYYVPFRDLFSHGGRSGTDRPLSIEGARAECLASLGLELVEEMFPVLITRG